MTDDPKPVLECRGLARRFVEGGNVLEVLRDVNMSVMPAERLAIIGASGSGKTTLLQILGGLDAPDDGEVYVGGEPMHGFVTATSGSFTSSITCCRNSRRRRTSQCRL